MLAEVERRIGPDCWPPATSSDWSGATGRVARRGPVCGTRRSTPSDHDPDGVPLPVMAPFATDAKATAMVGTPTYGFSPFRLEPDERFLERFHGVDERISLEPAVRAPGPLRRRSPFCG